jgi:AbiV family abortive infection protein
MSTSVSPQYLLEGAVYALEQCGLLLRDANLLYGSGSYATAVALAAFAREELGRWRILLDLRTKLLGGEHLTIEEIQKHCEGHVRKQGAGMTSITMRADTGSGLGKLLQTRHGSKEWQAAREQLEKLNQQKRRRVPDDRHKQRMSAHYVDAASPDRWNRPTKEISQTFASDFLQDAVNDYSIQFERYTKPEIIKHLDPELDTALAQWTDRPELTHPPQFATSNLRSSHMDRKTYFLVAGIIFTLVALFHLVRIYMDWPVVIADWSVPKWVSWVALIVAGGLAVLGFRFTENDED